MGWVVATDIGGTFTDLVAYDLDTGQTVHAKSHTAPADLASGVIRCLRKSGLPLGAATDLVHGSTVAINTVIERKGAVTALLVTQGTRDVYAIGRGNRPDAYNLFFQRPEPLVARRRTIEVTERLGTDGAVLVDLDEASVRDALAAAGDAESVAVCLLHSYANPRHEALVGEVAHGAAPERFVSCSHELLREYREYERMSTTVLNAYVGPRVSAYLGDLEKALAAEGFRGRLSIMQSNGGVMAPATARRQPVRTMESGPVGGAIAAGKIAARLGFRHAVAFDMGGTTAKAALVTDGAPDMSEGYVIGDRMSGHPVMLPVVDVVEVGAGGGSVARVDDVGALRVGPESAGGFPGPVCYGWGGGQPTVTDANAVLGRLAPDRFLGGEMPLDLAGARRAIEEAVAQPLAMSVAAAAQAVVDVAVTRMALAVRAVSIERGLDPRDCALIAFGGAGPLHAVDVARDLDIPAVVVPPLPGHYSAFGMLVSDVRHDYVRTCHTRLAGSPPAMFAEMVAEMEREALTLLADEGLGADEVRTEAAFDMRYAGQEFTLRVPVAPAEISPEGLLEVRRRFDRAHEERYGHAAPDEDAEVVNARVVGVGRRRSAATPPPAGRSCAGEPLGARDVGFSAAEGTTVKRCPVWDRDRLAPGARVAGPAVIQEYASTIVLDSGDAAAVGASGEIVIDVAPRRRTAAGARDPREAGAGDGAHRRPGAEPASGQPGSRSW